MGLHATYQVESGRIARKEWWEVVSLKYGENSGFSKEDVEVL